MKQTFNAIVRSVNAIVKNESQYRKAVIYVMDGKIDVVEDYGTMYQWNHLVYDGACFVYSIPARGVKYTQKEMKGIFNNLVFFNELCTESEEVVKRFLDKG